MGADSPRTVSRAVIGIYKRKKKTYNNKESLLLKAKGFLQTNLVIFKVL